MLRIVIVAIALTAGGACLWLLMATTPQEVAVVAQQSTTEILVASGDIASGKAIGENDLRWQAWPSEAVSAAYVSRSARPDAVASLKGKVVRSRIVAGEPIMEEKFSRSSAGVLASMLPAGKRAVAIRVSAESAAGGFILPDDKVDVVHALSLAGTRGEVESAGKTILTNIRVLAIDQQGTDSKTMNAAVVGKTATLELNAEQAEILAVAQMTGTLFLSLRSAVDTSDTPVISRTSGSSVQVYLGESSERVKVQ